MDMGQHFCFFLVWPLLCGIVAASGEARAAVADPNDSPMITDLNKLAQAGHHRATITSGDYKRKFIVVTPRGFTMNQALPIVFFFHGAGGNAQQAFTTYGWAEKADANHFLAVFPEGLGAKPRLHGNFLLNPNIWRDGRDAMPGPDVDDVAFFQDLLTRLQACLPIDPRRIYVTGFSNGAAMSFTLGARFADQIAAIAPVSSQCVVEPASLSRPLPVYYLTGNADPLVPYRGGTVTLPWGTVSAHPPIQDTVDQWARLDGCAPQPQSISDDGSVFVANYGPDRDHIRIRFTTIDGNGHHWPGTRELLPAAIVGPCLDPFNATDAIWDFFKQHPMKAKAL
jgi:polyhydroxybutyrate depolymerase